MRVKGSESDVGGLVEVGSQSDSVVRFYRWRRDILNLQTSGERYVGYYSVMRSKRWQ